MKLLLDTHTFLWFIDDNPKLSETALALLEGDHELLLSIVSLWEIAIKFSIGKLALPEPYITFIPKQLSQNIIEVLPIRLDHLGVVSTLPFHHRDPFDRLLVAQAFIEKIPVISIDDTLDRYLIERLW